jgi:hypothetical protein
MMCPLSMRKMMKKVLCLEYEEEPPYDEIIDIMKDLIVKDLIINSECDPVVHEFEW